MKRKRRRIRKLRRIFVCLCCIILVAGGGIMFLLKSPEPPSSDNIRLQTAVKNMNSRYMLLTNMETGAELISYRADQKIYPASMTKIMTALVCLDQIKDLKVQITVTEDIINKCYANDAMMAGFMSGESVKAKDLLYALLLASGADAAYSLAAYVSGSEEAFAKLMNEKAQQIGMNHTNFTNSVGLHDTKHYSTLEDMASLLTYAWSSETFCEIFCTTQYTTDATSYRSEGISFSSTLSEKLASISESLNNGYFLGGKTGTTQEAGLCLASVANIGGTNYMLITAKADYQSDGSAYHVIDAVNIYNSIE